jgi:hypothetical protein
MSVAPCPKSVVMKMRVDGDNELGSNEVLKKSWR